MAFSFILTLLPLLLWLAVLVFFIWGVISLISVQNERNKILKEISVKLDHIEFSKKSE